MLRGKNKTRNTKSSRRKLGNNGDGPWGQWANLSRDLFVSIIMRLGFVDYVACGGVCKSWRSIADDSKSTFWENQQPLAVVKSNNAKKACFLYNAFDGTRYKTLLPEWITHRWIVGLSCGYLVVLGLDNKFWLVNLITRDELHFPSLPRHFSFSPSEILSILFYSTYLSDYLLLVVNREFSSVLISQSRGANWRNVRYMGNASIMDLTIFNGEIYVLTRDARIGILRLNPFPLLKLFDVSISLDKSTFSPVKLVTSSKLLFMVSYFRYIGNLRIMIHKLDEMSMEWTKVNDLGEEALFLSDMSGGSAIVNPTKWGGRSNCIYVLESKINRWNICSLNPWQMLEYGPVVEERSVLVPYFWYFPVQSYSKNEIHGSMDM